MATVTAQRKEDHTRLFEFLVNSFAKVVWRPGASYVKESERNVVTSPTAQNSSK
jgi:hypothetical protein